MNNNFIGERVTSLRLQKGISEYKLSKNIGKCNNYINKVSSGRLVPTIETLFSICEYFGITLSQFFQEEDPADTLTASQIRAILPSLNEDQLKSLLVITNSMKTSNSQM